MTDTLIRSGGVNTPDVYMVSADQVTILGNGTTENPLRAGPGTAGGTMTAAFRDGGDDPFPGLPVFIAGVSEPGGITTVQQTDVRASEFTGPLAGSSAAAAGLIVTVNAGDTVEVQTSGIVTLTEAEWDEATGGSGGLVLGTTYYPAIFPDLGLTSTRPSAPGVFVTPVGVALNATMLLLYTPTISAQNLQENIYFPTADGNPPVGTAVRATSTASHVIAAVNSATVGEAQAIGILVSNDDGIAIVQTAGIVALTTSQWDGVTGDSGGLTPGAAYYVGPPNNLTTTRTATPGDFIAQVGIALSTTRLLLSTPAVPLVV